MENIKHTIEYSECKDSMKSKETIIKKAVGGFSRPYELRHVSEGYEIAGSAMRYVSEGYRVVSFDSNGTRHSKKFDCFEKAWDDFDRWTTPITEAV